MEARVSFGPSFSNLQKPGSIDLMKIYPNRPSYETLTQPVPKQTQFGSHFGTKPGPKLVLVEVRKDLAVIGPSNGRIPTQN